MARLSDRFDPNVERLSILPRPAGSLPSEGRGSVFGKGVNYKDWVAPQLLVDIVKAYETPYRALQGEEITPQEALNVATNVAGGGFAASGSAPAAALGAFKRGTNVAGIPIRELLYPGRGDLTPAEKSAVTKFEKDLAVQAVRRREEMRATGQDIVTPTPGLNLISEIAMNPQQLLGKRLVPVFGDMSTLGGNVSQVKGVPLSKPVIQQAGRRYPLIKSNVEENIAYASEPSAAASKIANFGKFGDEDVLGVFLAGAPKSVDFSHHMAQGLVRQLDTLRPSKDAIKEFDSAIKNYVVMKQTPEGKKVPTQPFKNFAGVTSPNIEEMMISKTSKDFTPGQLRTAISEEMAKYKFQKLGFPSYEDMAKVMLEPGLKKGYMGQTVFEAIPGRGIQTPSYYHQSYSAGIPGRYVGGLQNKQTGELGAPAEMLFPKLFAQKRAQGATDENILASMRLSHQGEKVTQETLDPLMKYLGF
jgi:hypothetical protein